MGMGLNQKRKGRLMNKLRVWWIPQVPMKPFLIDVESVEQAVFIMDTLARYDQFQLDNNIKPDYCNCGGLSMFDEADKTDGEDGSWVSWHDEETGTDEPREFLRLKGEPDAD